MQLLVRTQVVPPTDGAGGTGEGPGIATAAITEGAGIAQRDSHRALYKNGGAFMQLLRRVPAVLYAHIGSAV